MTFDTQSVIFLWTTDIQNQLRGELQAILIHGASPEMGNLCT